MRALSGVVVTGNHRLMGDYFEFWNLGADGSLIGHSVKIRTETGLILQCHPACDPDQVRYLASLARLTPNYPVDVTAWIGTPNNRRCTWSGRIYYRESGNVDHDRST